MAHTPSPLVIRHLPEIGVTVISRWIFNCYLVHDGGDGRPFVVDLGLPSQIPGLEAELHRLDAELADLGAAVATHGHADHVGGLPALQARVKTPVHLPQAIEELRAGRMPLRSPGLRDVAQILPVMADQPSDLGALRELGPIAKQIGYDAKTVRFGFEPSSWLRDGDHLPDLPDWEVIHAPGHTDDASCLYHAPTRTLLSGDSILAVGGRAWFTPEFVDDDQSATTEARLRPLDVEHLLPGHGRAVSGPRVLESAMSRTDRPADGSKLRALGRVLCHHAGRHRAPEG